MQACFFWGLLQHQPILEAQLNRAIRYEDASLAGFEAFLNPATDRPSLAVSATAKLPGKVLRDVTAQEFERMQFAQSCMGLNARRVKVDLAAGGSLEVWIFLPESLPQSTGVAVWNYDIWAAKFGAEYAQAAQDATVQFFDKPAIAARVPQLVVRAASKLRAQVAAETQLRRHADAGDVAVAARREPYARFFALEEIDVSYRRFDGEMSPQVTRAGLISCDAVTVLPYDPKRDRVLLIEQFRAGPQFRGDPQPWQLEAIAGRIDSGETPEEAARREAMEEAGLALDALLPVAQYYPSPGILSEFLYSYVALTDLPDGVAGVFGVEGEAEDIRGHLVSFDEMMRLVTSGEIGNGPMLLTAYWLAQNRARLRA